MKVGEGRLSERKVRWKVRMEGANGRCEVKL